MGFYLEWKRKLDSELNDQQFICDYIDKTEESRITLENGNTEDIAIAINVIKNIPIKRFFSYIEQKDYSRDAEPAEVPQFSNFEDGANRLVELLEFSPEGLTFENVGYQLMKSDKVGARVKYGENHSKLASVMSLVTIRKTSPRVVINTSLGQALVGFQMEEKKDLLRKLVLREYLVGKIINNAKKDITNYREMVCRLSDSTALRRRSNVKFLVEYALAGTENEYILKNINW